MCFIFFTPSKLTVSHNAAIVQNCWHLIFCSVNIIHYSPFTHHLTSFKFLINSSQVYIQPFPSTQPVLLTTEDASVPVTRAAFEDNFSHDHFLLICDISDHFAFPCSQYRLRCFSIYSFIFFFFSLYFNLYYHYNHQWSWQPALTTPKLFF